MCIFAAVQIGFSTPLYSVSESAGLIRIVVEVTGQTDAYFRANISTDSVTATGITALWVIGAVICHPVPKTPCQSRVSLTAQASLGDSGIGIFTSPFCENDHLCTL